MRRLLEGAWLAALALGVLMLSPVLIPISLAAHWFQLRRMRRAALDFVCLSCGETLGPASLERADAEWAELMREAGERNPLVIRRRMVRGADAICARCGARYKFSGSKSFALSSI